jgi:hypothetical protein
MEFADGSGRGFEFTQPDGTEVVSSPKHVLSYQSNLTYRPLVMQSNS